MPKHHVACPFCRSEALLFDFGDRLFFVCESCRESAVFPITKGSVKVETMSRECHES